MLEYLLMFVLVAMAIFMILLVLVQRGRGGGLAGALGGMGGQSAFGTKAGDAFTKITMWTAFFWIVLCAVTVKYMATPATRINDPDFGANRPAQVDQQTPPANESNSPAPEAEQ
jgi:preprotein translocase subunit SecG